MKVLITGFEPWGSEPENPSGTLAERFGGRVLPVDYRASGRALLRLVREERPGALLMLGLGPDRRKISLEAAALNVDHCEAKPYRVWRRPIEKKGPLVLRSRLPIDRLYRRLVRARIPVAVSHHAGTFICNHVFYLALARTKIPCGFVHVPRVAAVAWATQVRAIRILVETIEAQG
jgi:pyroglutamyl-peptidase